MKLHKIVEKMRFEVKSGEGNLDREVTGGYASDMLSDVLANSKPGALWVTHQTHLNIVAVASTKDLAGIVIVNGRVPPGETVNKAIDEGIPLMLAKDSAFQVVGELYSMGLR